MVDPERVERVARFLAEERGYGHVFEEPVDYSTAASQSWVRAMADGAFHPDYWRRLAQRVLTAMAD